MATAPKTSAATLATRNEVRGVIPRVIELTESLVYGDIWERPGLSKRDRSLITVAALVAMYRPEQLKGHTQRALANGVTKEEMKEVFLQVGAYCGAPAALDGFRIAREVVAEQEKATAK